MSAFSRGGGVSKTPKYTDSIANINFSIHFRKGARLPSVTVSLARERSDRAGEGCGRGYPPPMVGTCSKIRVSNVHFKAYTNDFLGN